MDFRLSPKPGALTAATESWPRSLLRITAARASHVGGKESSVESHTLGNLDLVLDRSSLLDSDDTFLADLLHCLGDDGADVDISVGGNGGDLLVSFTFQWTIFDSLPERSPHWW
jgi:hypothetical protein